MKQNKYLVGLLCLLFMIGFVRPTVALNYPSTVVVNDRLVYQMDMVFIEETLQFFQGYNVSEIADDGANTNITAQQWFKTNISDVFSGVPEYDRNLMVNLTSGYTFEQKVLPTGVKIGNLLPAVRTIYEGLFDDCTVNVSATVNGYGANILVFNASEILMDNVSLYYSTTGILLYLYEEFYWLGALETFEYRLLSDLSTVDGKDEDPFHSETTSTTSGTTTATSTSGINGTNTATTPTIPGFSASVMSIASILTFCVLVLVRRTRR